MTDDQTVESIFIPQEDEHTYCDAHRINFNRLDNGSIVVTSGRDIKDSVYTSVHINFPTGSWFDPEGKKGAHHLLEHLFNPPMRPIGITNDCDLNAYTQSQRIVHLLKGPANLSHTDFGIWNMLSLELQTFTNPLSQYPNIDHVLSKEKQVISNEIRSDLGNYEWRVEDELYKWMFDISNPEIDYPAGTHESVQTITADDLHQVSQHHLVSDGMIISAITDADQQTASELSDRLLDIWHKFDKPGEKQIVPQEDRNRFNPNADPEELYVVNTGISNDLITLAFTWHYSYPAFSTLDFAFDSVVEHVQHSIFDIIRGNGWSYKFGTKTYRSSMTHGFLAILIDLPSQSVHDVTALKDVIYDEIKASFQVSPEKIQQLTDHVRKRYQVWPIHIDNRFSWLMYGLQYYNRLVDIDKVTQRRLEITTADLQHWFDQFNQTKPFTAVIGDVKEG